jgi:23S rRNA (guanosine2251-2'-O)-methyltransferase
MTGKSHQIYLCINPRCGFRFHISNITDEKVNCPKCGGSTMLVNAAFQGLRVKVEQETQDSLHIETLLDNIRSTYNVGSMFRSADGAGIRHMHLCGMTACPENQKVNKTALGAEFAVPWTYHNDGLSTAVELKKQGMRLWALEGGEHSQSLFNISHEVGKDPILLIVGNEVSGIDPGIIEICDHIIHIPMQGFKRSLNVAVAFGIAVYFLRYISNSQQLVTGISQ